MEGMWRNSSKRTVRKKQTPPIGISADNEKPDIHPPRNAEPYQNDLDNLTNIKLYLTLK